MPRPIPPIQEKGQPTKFIWEYQGPIRATLRIDGVFKNTSGQEWIAYTTRITFFAGKTHINIEHTLRNSLQTNQRHVKIKSATIQLGDGSTFVRAAQKSRTSWSNSLNGVRFELLPITFEVSGFADSFDVDANGGWILADLTHEEKSLYVDFEENLSSSEKAQRLAKSKSILFAMAPPSWYSDYGELSTTRFGTLTTRNRHINHGAGLGIPTKSLVTRINQITLFGLGLQSI